VDVPILGEKKPANGPQIRLLYCRICHSIEELPDYEGDPRNDTLLEISAERHRHPAGESGTLFTVDLRVWAVPQARKKIIEQIKGGVSKGLGEIDESYYDTRSTFYEDAMKCYNAHLRPKGQCPDYMSDAKILRPKTAADRKELGLTPVDKMGGPKVRLCQFCPAHTYNVTRAREQQGAYN